jgi:queuine tRNA-ribosyltransferase
MKLKRRFLNLPHGQLSLPLFMPDATFGVVRSVDCNDLVNCGIHAVVMNAFHIMQRPGSSVIKAAGGLHNFAGWVRPIITDSGGFQAYSLIRQNPKSGSITDKGIIFRSNDSSRRFLLTPEKSMQLQLDYDSDLLICLDDCTHVSDPFEAQQASVNRTVRWAKRCKAEFEKRVKLHVKPKQTGPLLFAVVQGGGSQELRKKCAEALLEIGFDGFAYGGYPLDDKGNLLTDAIELTRELIPARFPMIALGIGHPRNVLKCLEIGYDLFDSSLPTRDARQGRLYTSGTDDKHAYVYIQDRKHIKSRMPISSTCDCLTCSHYSLDYLHHLFKIRDANYLRLATIHNLRIMTRLIEDFVMHLER